MTDGYSGRDMYDTTVKHLEGMLESLDEAGTEDERDAATEELYEYALGVESWVERTITLGIGGPHEELRVKLDNYNHDIGCGDVMSVTYYASGMNRPSHEVTIRDPEHPLYRYAEVIFEH